MLWLDALAIRTVVVIVVHVPVFVFDECRVVRRNLGHQYPSVRNERETATHSPGHKGRIVTR